MGRRLLVVTRVNSRATVHRSAYLDYIGFKVFDARGDNVGERRFLGLFSRSAYRTSVRDLPVIPRKMPRCRGAGTLRTCWRSWSRTRDEPFQIKTDDLYQTTSEG